MRIRKFNESIEGDLTPDSLINVRGKEISIKEYITGQHCPFLPEIVENINHIYDSLLYFTDHGYDIIFYKMELVNGKLIYNIGIYLEIKDSTRVDRFTDKNGYESYDKERGTHKWQSESYNLEEVRKESDIKKWIDVNKKTFDFLEKSINFLKEKLEIVTIHKGISISLVLKSK